MFQENKARQIFLKMNITYPHIRTQRTGGKKYRFSENLAWFVFLKHPLWDSRSCFITDEFILNIFSVSISHDKVTVLFFAFIWVILDGQSTDKGSSYVSFFFNRFNSSELEWRHKRKKLNRISLLSEIQSFRISEGKNLPCDLIELQGQNISIDIHKTSKFPLHRRTYSFSPLLIGVNQKLFYKASLLQC